MFTTAQMLEWLFAFLMATAFFAGFGAIGSVVILPRAFLRTAGVFCAESL